MDNLWNGKGQLPWESQMSEFGIGKKYTQNKKACFKTNLDHLLCLVLSSMLFAILRIPENPTLFVLL